MTQDEGLEELVDDVEIVEDTPRTTQAARGYAPAADAGWQPEAVDRAHGKPSRGKAIASGAFAVWWMLLPFGVKVAIFVLGPIVALLILLLVVTVVVPQLASALFYPPVWPVAAFLITWLVARRRRDGRGPIDHVKLLTATIKANQKAVRTGVIVGAGLGLAMAAAGYLQGHATILDGLLNICGTLSAAGLAVAAYLESRRS